MRHVQRLFMVNLMLFIFACHNEPDSRDNEAADRGSLCTAAGATLNSTTNECECSGGQKWSGSRCEAEVAAAAKPQEMELAAQEAAKAPQNDIKDMAPATLMPEAKAVIPEQKLTEKASALSPAEVASLKKACENNSLNNGKWDLAKNRCQCPSGRIWLDGLCALQSRLSSAVICESGFNSGTWDSSHKRCHCQNGQMWLNQSCMDPHALPSRNVCESEFNRGTWNTTRQSCSCPRGARWDSKNLQCQGRAG